MRAQFESTPARSSLDHRCLSLLAGGVCCVPPFWGREESVSVTAKCLALICAVICKCIWLNLREIQLHRTLPFFTDTVAVKTLGLKNVRHVSSGGSNTDCTAQAAPPWVCKKEHSQGKKRHLIFNHCSPQRCLSYQLVTGGACAQSFL